MRVRDYLNHILSAIQHSTDYVSDMTLTEFKNDTRNQHAVIMNIIIVGEAANKLINEYPDFVDNHSNIPWNYMRAMRNRIAHGYFDINLDLVWATVKQDFPALSQQLSQLNWDG